MKEKPIIFSGPMVRAILDGRKTMTRRVVKLQPVPEPARFEIWSRADGLWYPCSNSGRTGIGNWGGPRWRCPFGIPGDHLWVRETWADTSKECPRCPVSYRATWPPEDEEGRCFKWKSSRFMPRWASRITLEVTGVRVERLQDITEEDAKEEGVYQRCEEWLPTDADPNGYAYVMAADAFRTLWDSINSRRGFGWDANPWVWVISFRRVAE